MSYSNCFVWSEYFNQWVSPTNATGRSHDCKWHFINFVNGGGIIWPLKFTFYALNEFKRPIVQYEVWKFLLSLPDMEFCIILPRAKIGNFAVPQFFWNFYLIHSRNTQKRCIISRKRGFSNYQFVDNKRLCGKPTACFEIFHEFFHNLKKIFHKQCSRVGTKYHVWMAPLHRII